jgi:hypothetical protein
MSPADSDRPDTGKDTAWIPWIPVVVPLLALLPTLAAYIIGWGAIAGTHWGNMSTRSFFGGVLIGLAIDLPPFSVNDNDEFELRTLLLRWGVLAVSGVALYVARPTRLCIRLPNKAMVPSQRVSRQP